MSLNYKQFMEACREWEEMDKRLIKLIGFNPATSNHYGLIVIITVIIIYVWWRIKYCRY